MGNKLETKYSAKAGNQGSGKAMPAQIGKMTAHGRDLRSPHPDRFLKGSNGMKGKVPPA